MRRTRSDTRIFIGSSSESKEIAEYLQLALDAHFETTIWDQGVFTLSTLGLSALLKAPEDFDVAVLIYAADDVTNKRNLEKAAPRDNVIFESGVFMGTLGAERTYLVHCADDDLHIPTDLHGMTLAPFRRRRDGNLQAAINPVAVKIREAVRKLGTRNRKMNTRPHESSVSICDSHSAHSAFRHLTDGIRGIARGFAGVVPTCKDAKALGKWVRNIIGMLWDTFAHRQDDVYVAWLRPERKAKELTVFVQRNLKAPKSHYSFNLGEGLAGMVWKEGVTAATSQLRQHKWWVFREGCENMAYICSCVGPAGGKGGVLAVGSDRGFEIVPGDEEKVEVFASLLEIALSGFDNVIKIQQPQTPNKLLNPDAPKSSAPVS